MDGWLPGSNRSLGPIQYEDSRRKRSRVGRSRMVVEGHAPSLPQSRMGSGELGFADSLSGSKLCAIARLGILSLLRWVNEIGASLSL